MFSYLLRCVRTVLLVLGYTSAVHAGAIDNITVGQAGLAGNCTVATIQAAINLAAQHPGPDTIWVSRDTPDGYYLATSALSISNQDVEIIGGFDDCFDETPSGFTDISGNGNAADPVFRIRGTGAVRLQNLTITLGDADNNEGAGIDYQGNGVLEVLNTILNFNHAQGNGAGGGIRFSGTNAGGDLVISNSFIHDNSAQLGGGVAFGGTGRLIVNNSAINSNTARGSGGGVYLKSSGGTISAYLEQGVAISGNSAGDDGGGLYAGTQVGLEWNGADGEMWLNTAADMGGGIFATDGATADLFPRGRLFPPTGQYHGVFSGNSARHGGAIASDTSGSDRDVSIRLTPFDTQSAQIVNGNNATDLGGAFFLKAYFGDGLPSVISAPDLCLFGTAVAGNTAARGAAIYAQRDEASTGHTFSPKVLVNATHCGFAPRPECNVGLECSTFEGNQATQGAIVEIEADDNVNSISVVRTKLVGNSGTYLVRLDTPENDSAATFRSNLIALNTLSNGVLRTSRNVLTFENNTVVDNTIAQAVLDVSAREGMSVARNIIVQPGSFTFNFNSGAPPAGSVVDNLSNDVGLQGLDPSNFDQNPLFAVGYRLTLSSPAVDRAIGPDGSRDLARNPRPFDHPDVANYALGTTTDLGAYELQQGPPNALFSNSFE